MRNLFLFSYPPLSDRIWNNKKKGGSEYDKTGNHKRQDKTA
jgi:hypothetical protein